MDVFNDELGRVARFAESNGNDDASIARLKKRLSQNRTVSAEDSSMSWVRWQRQEDFLGQPFSVTKIPLSKLEQMSRDSMISLGLMYAKIPLVRAPWYIKCEDPKIAAFVDGALRRIYGRFILAYCNSFNYGFSAIIKRFEVADNVPWTYVDNSGEQPEEKSVWTDDVIKPLVWKEFLALNPRSVVPHWSAGGDFAGIDLFPSMVGDYTSGSAQFPFEPSSGGVADIPLDWSLWATNEKDSVFGSLWGYPRIGYAYRYWWSYWYRYGLADRAFEKWADPPIVVRHPTEVGLDTVSGENVDYGAEALGLAEKIRSGANVSLPSDPVTGLDDRILNMRQWEIDTITTEVNFDALNVAFEYLDVQKLRAILVPEQALIEGKGGSSSRNVAQVFGDLFQEFQAVTMEEIDWHINRYMIPQLVEANFGPNAPIVEKITTGFDPADAEAIQALLVGITNKGAEPLPIDARKSLEKLGVPTLSIDEQNKQMKKAADAAAAAVPPPTPGVPGKQATVNQAGLYESVEADVNLSEDEKGRFRSFFDRMFN
jgi:hypothetical protein